MFKNGTSKSTNTSTPVRYCAVWFSTPLIYKFASKVSEALAVRLILSNSVLN